jgi:hypothetical protein
LCSAGTLHLCRVEDFLAWAKVDAVVWEAETAGETRLGTDKVGALRARLVRKVGVLTHRLLVEWACDCADRGLSQINYPRSTEAIEVTRKWLAGTATIEEVRTATDAARPSAKVADTADARASISPYYTRVSPYYAIRAAFSAARAADHAYFATGAAYFVVDAIPDLLRLKERKWQGERLLQLLSRQEQP